MRYSSSVSWTRVSETVSLRRGIVEVLLTILLALVVFFAFSWFIHLFPDNISKTMRLILVSGGFGGLIYGFTERERRFEFVRYQDAVGLNCGSLADILIGIGAAFAVFLVFAGSINIDTDKSVDNTLRLLGLGVLSGIGGKSLLAGLQRRLARQLEEIGEKVREVEVTAVVAARKASRNYWYTVGENYRLRDEWQDAKYAYRKAIEEDADFTAGLLGLATTLRDEASKATSADEKDELLKEAWDSCEMALRKEPDYAMALVVRASLNLVLNKADSMVRDDLEKAIEIEPGLREFIAKDRGLDGIRAREWFRKLTGAMEERV